VKALAILSVPGLSNPLLISGGAESEILFWDIKTSTRLHVLKGHVRGILDLKFDPSSIYPGTEAAILYSASSDREVRICSIPIPSDHTLTPSSLKALKLSPPLLVHETSVYALHFDSDGSGIWTASADKNAKHLSRKDPDAPASNSVVDELNPSLIWEEDTSLPHPDFVRSVTTHPTLPVVITACRDEEIRLFNPSTGKLEHTYSGHYEEVTGLCVRGNNAVSVSIDGTIRSWSLLKQDIEASKKELEQLKNGEVEKEGSGAGPGESMLTEEEERELAELMGDD